MYVYVRNELNCRNLLRQVMAHSRLQTTTVKKKQTLLTRSEKRNNNLISKIYSS